MSPRHDSGFAPAGSQRPAAVHLLIVEDNLTDLRLLRVLLAGAKGGDYEIEHVDRLAPAVERLRARAPDLVLLDLSLPDSDGRNTVQRIRAVAPDVPIVVLTGLADMELVSEAFSAGAQDYILKDELSSQVLLRALRNAIERKHAETVLAECEADLRALLEGTGDTVFRLFRDGRVELMTSGGRALVNVQRGRLADLVAPPSTKVLMSRLEEFLDGEAPMAVVPCESLADGVARAAVAHFGRRGPDVAIVALRPRL